jgi:uroporphyrin-III C-methyltransferase
MSTPAMRGRVYLVGAGPGDPDLLTVKALRLLQSADVVLHDALIDPRVLALALQARCIDVSKRACRPSTAQRFINRALVAAARSYGVVVRLKGGDPTVFGRLDEETSALRAAGLDFEIVPGVTAACAAAARLQASLTLRGTARSVRFLTPRVAAGLDGTAADPADGETLVVYMAGQMLAGLAARWMKEGRAAGTPLVVVEGVSTPDERCWRGTLATAADWPGNAAGGPVLVLTGPALAQAAVAAAAVTARARAA